MNKKLTRVIALALGTAIGATCMSALVGCSKSKKDSVVLMTEALSGLFNPFYATSGTDQDIIGMTQIGMLTTDDNGNPTCGNDEATVVLDYAVETVGEDSVYTFVLKNGLVFSDGYALTMNDVFFNMYEYLDPVYTGSSTMYSTKIKGLTTYRLQSYDTESSEDSISQEAISIAKGRVDELLDIYVEANESNGGTTSSYYVTEEQFLAEIDNWTFTDSYKDAVGENPDGASDDAYYRALAKEDYYHICELFLKELETDFETAKDAYDIESEPYKTWADKTHFKNDVFKFFYYEGMITPKYVKVEGLDDKNQIESFEHMDFATNYPTQAKAIDYVYTYYIRSKFDSVLSGWGTATTISTEFAAKAKEVLLHDRVEEGGLEYKNITGIESLGHTSDKTSVSFTSAVSGQTVTYAVSHSHDENYANGTNKNYGANTDDSKYDVLQITVEGTDPKAIYNFGFTVAPAHYYTADSAHPNGVQIDIANNEFGVEWGSYTFQSKTIQSEAHVSVPVGAGPFVATDKNNADNPSGSAFWNSNVVYFKKNENFTCLGEDFEVQAEKLRFQVISSNNALDNLASGSVDYVTPQLTQSNSDRLKTLKKQGIESMAGWQLGYGYIGINAGKVPNIYIRRAIMAAMQTELSLDYYEPGTCTTIAWPMSKVSWAYPSTENNGKSYMKWEETRANIENGTYLTTVTKIKALLEEAKKMNNYSSSMLNIKFTIAGSSITEHPTYAVFKQAATILNMCGFNVEVVADSQALVKLSTGSLAVWAAAWGSTIDPDMYQVYSPYSTATSVKAWGYPQILASPSTYETEYSILTGTGGLADLIDEARSTNDQSTRKSLYQQAMDLVLDLAVEMPVYQRQTLYAYNSKTITGFADCLVTDPTSDNYGLVNPYSSPLGRIWEIKLV